MLRLAVFTLVLGGLGASPGLAQTAASVQAGHAVFEDQCAGCHSNQAGVDRFGPTLAGIYGRTSGTAPLHVYSPAMKSAHVVWDAKNLNGFLENPRRFMPGTIMPYSGLASGRARADVIAYLKSISRSS